MFRFDTEPGWTSISLRPGEPEFHEAPCPPRACYDSKV